MSQIKMPLYFMRIINYCCLILFFYHSTLSAGTFSTMPESSGKELTHIVKLTDVDSMTYLCNENSKQNLEKYLTESKPNWDGRIFEVNIDYTLPLNPDTISCDDDPEDSIVIGGLSLSIPDGLKDNLYRKLHGIRDKVPETLKGIRDTEHYILDLTEGPYGSAIIATLSFFIELQNKIDIAMPSHADGASER